MFKKFVFIPPMILALLIAAVMAHATYKGLTSEELDLTEATGEVTDTWLHATSSTDKIASALPVISGTHEGQPFECRCQPNSCEPVSPEEATGSLRVLIDRAAPGTCYDAARGVPGTAWVMPLALTALMLLTCVVCGRALRRSGARTH
jgi:hypothetical protein